MPTTPRGVPYPAPGSPNNVPADLYALATFIDENGGLTSLTTAERDALTGEQLWEARVPGDPLGGTLVVNDLVLTATLQGTIVALDRQTGDVVWQEQAPGGINGWMVAAGVCAPSASLTAGLVLAGALLTRPTRRAWGIGAVALIGGSLPWAGPALLGPGLIAPSGQFAAFGARGESAVGVLPSVLSLGGIWKSSIVPPERGSVVVVAVAAFVSIAASCSVRGDRPPAPERPDPALRSRTE